ncbi:MAG TPA: UDP-N-acetylmuramate dehydrogenase [Streptosporangiaceae bacterium]|nr:UDP-N-acetylmuramate dehydrogenase [Streptosporangiaceae bacterium]
MAEDPQQVLLAQHTTLRLGGPAGRFVVAAAEAEVLAAVRAADERGEPLLVLGGGSNLVIADAGFPGTVVHIATRGLDVSDVDGQVSVAVAAGEDWDTVVAWSVAEGLAGLECLSGIPGRAGATPIQNVGAYGQEVAETVTGVRAFDRATGEVVEMAAADCGFGYRTSAFKRATTTATGRFVVLGVTFRLDRSPLSRPVGYRELARVLGIAEGERAPLAEARAAVLGLRRGKGMVLDPHDPDTFSAGSFFTNPVLGTAQFEELQRVVGDGTAVPSFPAGDGQRKVPAAWLIEHAGFIKGYPGSNGDDAAPRISTKHTLALVNPCGATTASLVALAAQIRDGVRDTFGVELVPEPVLVGIEL